MTHMPCMGPIGHLPASTSASSTTGFNIQTVAPTDIAAATKDSGVAFTSATKVETAAKTKTLRAITGKYALRRDVAWICPVWQETTENEEEPIAHNVGGANEKFWRK